MLFFQARVKRRSHLRQSRRLLLETLEDRVVLTIPYAGEILVANTDRPDLSGVIGVDPSSGKQTQISVGGYFAENHDATNLCEGPDGTVYVTDVGETPSGESVPTPNSGALIAVSPSDGSQRLVASGLPGPNADAFINGSLYVAYGGKADRNFHTLAPNGFLGSDA